MTIKTQRLNNQQEEVLTNSILSKYLLDILPYPAVIIDKERILIYANKEAEKIEVINGKHCWDSFGKKASISEEDSKKVKKNCGTSVKGIKCAFCMANNAIETQTQTKRVTTIGETLFEIYWIPIDENTFLHYGIDITKK